MHLKLDTAGVAPIIEKDRPARVMVYLTPYGLDTINRGCSQVVSLDEFTQHVKRPPTRTTRDYYACPVPHEELPRLQTLYADSQREQLAKSKRANPWY